MDFLNTPEKRERRVVHLPMGRFGEAIEQAKGALFLATDDSSYITGTDFLIDGGAHACYVVSDLVGFSIHQARPVLHDHSRKLIMSRGILTWA